MCKDDKQFLPLIIGKYYKRRDGSKVKVLETEATKGIYPVIIMLPNGITRHYTIDGRYTIENEFLKMDIISEWKESYKKEFIGYISTKDKAALSADLDYRLYEESDDVRKDKVKITIEDVE